MPCYAPVRCVVSQGLTAIKSESRITKLESHTGDNPPPVFRGSNRSRLIGLFNQSRNTRTAKYHPKRWQSPPDAVQTDCNWSAGHPLTQPPRLFPRHFPSKIAWLEVLGPKARKQIFGGGPANNHPIYDSITTPGNASLSTSSINMSTKTEPPDPVSPSDESDMSADMPDVELGLGTEGTASEQLERLRSKLSLQDQSSRLPLRQVLIIFFGLAIAMFLAFLDMTTVSTALPTIARDFDASTEVSWVGTSFLIANTSMQILYGRLSDVFGRKVVLMSAIGLFAVGNILCGFSQSMVLVPAEVSANCKLQLIVFRGISGAGGGGIVSLTMIIISDIVSLKERGKYQGMLGSAIAVGGGLGPLLGGIFAQSASWRWYVLLENVSDRQGVLVLSSHFGCGPYPTLVLPSSRQSFREHEI